MNELFRSIALQLERPVDELDVTGMTLLGHFFFQQERWTCDPGRLG